MFSFFDNGLEIKYKDAKMCELTDDELKQCSQLFSENYGIYSEFLNDSRKGRNIKMSVNHYKKHYMKDFYKIAMAFDKEVLIAHAIYANQTFDG